jgi:L-malate glycosyltransferase
MRITFVLPSFGTKPMGGYRIVYQYANGLARRGDEVAIVHAAFLEPWQYGVPLAPGREPKVLIRGLVDIARGADGIAWQSIDPRVRLHFVPTLAASNVPDADVVVATAWRTAESVARSPERKGRQCYLIQHHEVWDAPAARVDATWRAPLTKIVIAEWLHAKGLELGVDPSLLLRLPGPGIDDGLFRVTRPLDDRPRRVAMLWSSARVKGGPDGVAALEEARRQVPDLRAVLFGVRPRPRHLPAWIDYAHNPSQAHLVDDVYNGSSIYLCPSWSEGWHLPPAEAMASGCALVSTEIDGVRDYAIAGQTALLADVGDTRGLAGRIVELCRDDGHRQRLARAGVELMRGFTAERSIEAFAGHVHAGPRVAR